VVEDNKYVDNKGWGILFVPYPDANLSSDGRTCTGTGGLDVQALLESQGVEGVSCLYDPEGDALLDNQFSGDGTLGNAGNADFGNLVAGGDEEENCFAGNTDSAAKNGAATDADVIDGYPSLTPSTCGKKTPTVAVPLVGANTDQTLLMQAECDSGVLATSDCSGAAYPQPTKVTMVPLPGSSSLTDPEASDLPSMNPCSESGLPANEWCSGGQPIS